jgi:exonuclease VII small subunit
MFRKTHNKLEAFLDRLEHGELRLPEKKQEWQKRFGL